MLITILWFVGCISENRDSSAAEPTEAAVGVVGGEPLVVPELRGIRGTEGTLLWLAEDDVSVSLGWILQASTGRGEWEDLSDLPPPWSDVGSLGGAWYRLYHPETDATGMPFQPQPIGMSLALAADLLLDGETLALTMGGVEKLPRPMVLTLSASSDSPAGCAVGLPWSATVGPSDPLMLPELTVSVASPSRCSLVAILRSPDEDGGQVLDYAAIGYLGLGYGLAWGDLHAHSNLSNDGCEQPDALCASRDGVAAGDFFDRAADLGLDFAAITDHAEYASYVPYGQTERFSIWSAQSEAVQLAEGSTVLPVLGYEWTSTSGHKTVLLEAPDACAQYRIAGRPASGVPSFLRMGPGDLFFPGNPLTGTTPSALWAALDSAGADCAPSRALTFFHHSAMSLPQQVDWTNSRSTPDPRYETVVEITSEHGTSECRSLEQELCDYRIKLVGSYVDTGSVQQALGMGYRLGFVAGTDSHDSRPGSTDDGPSATAFPDSTGTIPFHDYPGGLTAILHDDPLDRGELFDTILQRHTLASTGPRLNVRVALLDQSGHIALPGDVVAADDGPFLLRLAVDELPDTLTVLGIEVLDPATGDILVRAAHTSAWEVPLELTPGDAPYVRIRLEGDDGEEERLWLSPFFAE